jgi:hypothetical protein
MKCHECGETISDKAADCPHCGASVQPVTDEAGVNEPSSDTSGESNGDKGTLDPDSTPLDGPGTGNGATTPTDDPGQQSDEFGQPPEEASGSPATAPTRPLEEESPAEPLDGPTDEPGQDEPGDPLAGEAPVGGPQPSTDEPADADATAARHRDGRPAAPGGVTPDEPASGTDGPVGGQGPPPAGNETPPGGHARETQRGGHGEGDGFDAGEFLTRVPFFPGAAAGFATGIILFTISVAFAAMIPGARSSTLELGALVTLDLQFATTGHVTPEVFDLFEIVAPRPTALGILYLLPPLGLYTASKFVVALNRDEESTLPEAVVGGPTVLLGYFPIMVVVFVLAAREGLVAPSLLGLFLAGLVYPIVFGVAGGLAGGGLTGSERRVGTVYTLGAIFVIAIGSFLGTFIAAVGAPGSPNLLTHVLVGSFSWVAANLFVYGGGPVLGPTGILALFVTGLTLVAAAFVRTWRAETESARRGIPKGFTMGPTYLIVLGLYASLVPWLADSYIQEEVGVEFLAASYADFIVRMRLSGILEYVIAVFVATILFAVVLTGVTSGVATLLRAELRGSEK